jgi:hypothetical protein
VNCPTGPHPHTATVSPGSRSVFSAAIHPVGTASERKSTRPGGRPAASAMSRYDDASALGPVVVSKYPWKSGVRSPATEQPKYSRCAWLDPDDYTYSRAPRAAQARRAGATSG